MVKNRPGSRRNRTKLTTSAKRSARKAELKSRNGIASKDMNLLPIMRGEWDKHATAVTNFRKMGLQSSVNSITKSRVITHRVVSLPLANLSEKSEAVQLLEAKANRSEKERHQKLFQGEMVALQRLTEKYGEDWDAMARDTKLNYLQWTSRQLQKKYQRIQKVMEDRKERYADSSHS